MKRMRVVTSILVLLGISQLAVATDPWGTPVTITNYFAWTHNAAYIRISPVQNPDGCSNPSMLFIDSNDANFKYVWSIVLSAYNTGSTVSVNLQGCVNGMPQVRAVAVPAIW